MRPFKFFQKEDEERTIPLLPNEQLIRYWNDGENSHISSTRVISWSNEEYMWRPRWSLIHFIGTMEEFFTDRLEIPVIRHIGRVGSFSFMENDILMQHHYHGEYEIFYYAYI